MNINVFMKNNSFPHNLVRQVHCVTFHKPLHVQLRLQPGCHICFCVHSVVLHCSGRSWKREGYFIAFQTFVDTLFRHYTRQQATVS